MSNVSKRYAGLGLAAITLSGCAMGSPAAGASDDSLAPRDVSARTVSLKQSASGLDVLRVEYDDLDSAPGASDAVVVARALGNRVRTVSGARPVGSTEPAPTLDETYTRLQVLKVIRGHLPDSPEVSQLGSAADGGQDDSAPLLRQGETYLLFLKKGAVAHYAVTGGSLVYQKRGSDFTRTAGHTPAGTARSSSSRPIPEMIPEAAITQMLVPSTP